MKTKAVEGLTGMTAKNMQYYEAEGLLKPERNPKNGYRDYSESDVKRLQQIKMLRLLDIPIAEIREALERGGDLEPYLKNRGEHLKTEIKDLEAQRDLCELFIHQNRNLEELTDLNSEEIEQEVSEYRYMMEKLRRRDERKRRRSLFFTVGFLTVCGAACMIYMISLTLEASQQPFLTAGVWIIMLAMIGYGIVQAVKSGSDGS